jgi:hypothetical protein
MRQRPTLPRFPETGDGSRSPVEGKYLSGFADAIGSSIAARRESKLA